MSLLWEISPWVFLLVTVALGGGAAWLAGRGLALAWRPYWRVVLYMLILGGAVRFLHFALFDGTLLSPYYYVIDTIVLIIAASLGFRITRTNQMVNQYRWLYRRTSPFTWAERQLEQAGREGGRG